MKYRFAVEVDFEGSVEDAEALLDQILGRGMRSFGHNYSTLPISLEKMRQRPVDLDKPLKEQGK